MVMRNTRIQLFMTTVALICIGVVMIYSASSIYALEKYKDSAYFLKRHLAFILIGALLMFSVMAFDYRKLKQYARVILLVALVLLILVLIPKIGREVAGARRWFRFKFISFQPAEFANIAMIVYVADFISRKVHLIKTLRWGILPVVSVLGFTSLLILLQPDLGTVLALGTVVLAMLLVGGIKWSYVLSAILGLLPLLYILIFSVPYRRARIIAFLNPWADPKGSGFQIIQSQIALGSGGIFGTGLGHSQQKLFYLPAAHTDFIFSIIGEELGLLGTACIILLFAVFIRLGIKIIRNAPDRFGYFLSLGLVVLLSLKVMVNIGVSCALLPTKGLPLPFISYGGSSFIFDMISVGILLNIARAGEYP
jgi:cell division protein FtsW